MKFFLKCLLFTHIFCSLNIMATEIDTIKLNQNIDPQLKISQTYSKSSFQSKTYVSMACYDRWGSETSYTQNSYRTCLENNDTENGAFQWSPMANNRSLSVGFNINFDTKN